MSFLKGDIFYCDLSNSRGCVQNGTRPVIVVSNNFFNGFSSNVVVIPITSNLDKITKTHILIDGENINECGLKQESKITCEQILTVSKEQVLQRIGHAGLDIKKQVNEAIKFQLAL